MRLATRLPPRLEPSWMRRAPRVDTVMRDDRVLTIAVVGGPERQGGDWRMDSRRRGMRCVAKHHRDSQSSAQSSVTLAALDREPTKSLALRDR